MHEFASVIIGDKAPPNRKRIKVAPGTPLPATTPADPIVAHREGKVGNLDGTISGSTAFITVNDIEANYGPSSTGKTEIVGAGQLVFEWPNGTLLCIQISAYVKQKGAKD